LTLNVFRPKSLTSYVFYLPDFVNLSRGWLLALTELDVTALLPHHRPRRYAYFLYVPILLQSYVYYHSPIIPAELSREYKSEVHLVLILISHMTYNKAYLS